MIPISLPLFRKKIVKAVTSVLSDIICLGDKNKIGVAVSGIKFNVGNDQQINRQKIV